MPAIDSKKERKSTTTDHPYLIGNFAPVKSELPLTTCKYIGTIPDELLGGEYVRNGGNPAVNEDLGRDVHWFDVSFSWILGLPS